MVDYFILRTRFRDNQPMNVLLKRRDDWIRDLNMNLVRGKVIRSTHFFDELADPQKLQLLKALDSEQGAREDSDAKIIEQYIRSMSFFKPYAEFESIDFASVVQECKLVKCRAGTRLTNYGDTAENIYIIISGRVALGHPNAEWFKI